MDTEYAHISISNRNTNNISGKMSGLKLSYSSRDALINILWSIQIVKLLFTQLFAVPNYSSSSGQNISLSNVLPIAHGFVYPWRDLPVHTSVQNIRQDYSFNHLLYWLNKYTISLRQITSKFVEIFYGCSPTGQKNMLQASLKNNWRNVFPKRLSPPTTIYCEISVETVP